MRLADPTQVTPKPDVQENKEQPVTLGKIRGTVTGPQGPVENAAIILEDRVCATDKAGNYEFTELPAGTYEVMAVAPKGLVYNGQPQKVVLEPGQVAVVDFVVEKPVAILEAYVYNDAGGSVGGAVLSGVLCNLPLESRADLQSRETDDNGLAKFEDVTSGDRYVRVKAKGYVAEIRNFKAEEGTTTRLDFHLKPGAYKIKGRITSEVDGGPMVAEVSLTKRDTGLSRPSWLVMQRTVSSDKDGYYEISDLDSGHYGVIAVAPYYMQNAWNGLVSSDLQVDLKLRPAPKREERESD